MTQLRKLFGKRLKELLKIHKMKQCELAEFLGVDPQSISRMISGKHFPKEENLEKMVQAFNIPPEMLFTFSHVADENDLITDIVRLMKNAPGKKIRQAHKIITTLFE